MPDEPDSCDERLSLLKDKGAPRALVNSCGYEAVLLMFVMLRVGSRSIDVNLVR